MTQDLKQCPYCDGNNLDISNKVKTIDRIRKRHIAVYCKGCYAYGPRVIATERREYKEKCDPIHIQEAIDLWNCRVSTLRGANKEIKAMLSSAK